MSWYNRLSELEYFFIALFLVAYLLYVYRIISIATLLGNSYSKVLIKLGLRTIILALLVLSIMGPSYGTTSKEVKSVGKDIFIAIDLSESMNASDVNPSRLEKVKFELKNIVKSFNSDRIGLIIFSSDAFVQCPLTYDQSALSLFIETLNTSLVYSGGTDFAPALELAVNKITKKEEARSDQKSKIIILISDGEDFGSDAENAVEGIKRSGIKLYTLGVGTESGTTIKTRKGLKKDKDGNEVVTRLNDNALKKLANQTDGEYFEISERKNEVPTLISQINKIEGELMESRQMDVSSNRYQIFLAIAIGLLCFDVLFGVRILKL